MARTGTELHSHTNSSALARNCALLRASVAPTDNPPVRRVTLASLEHSYTAFFFEQSARTLYPENNCFFFLILVDINSVR